jgi:hypothetical protein
MIDPTVTRLDAVQPLLLKCFRTVAKGIWDAASEVKARYPDIKMDFRTPGIKAFTSERCWYR